MAQAECKSPDAPEIPTVELFKVKMGATVDCLSPDYETWQDTQPCTTPECREARGL